MHECTFFRCWPISQERSCFPTAYALVSYIVQIHVWRMRLGKDLCPMASAKGFDFVICTARQRFDVCFFLEEVQLISCCLF